MKYFAKEFMTTSAESAVAGEDEELGMPIGKDGVDEIWLSWYM
jgi:hypothetical protein